MGKDVVELVRMFGGVATFGAITAYGSRRDLDAALASGALVRIAQGRYALPTATIAIASAHRTAGVAASLSAAAYWGWELKWQPRRPVIVVPRGRHLPQAFSDLDVRRRTLSVQDFAGEWVTTPLRTVMDCARELPFDEALAVADSALRSGKVTVEQLRSALETHPHRGRARLAAIVAHADARAANPFESGLRAIGVAVPGLHLEPQVRIDSAVTGRFLGRVDLADRRLRILVEADSFEFHGERELFERDCERYDELVIDGWLVLRFGWGHVMQRAAWVQSVLERAVVARSALAA